MATVNIGNLTFTHRGDYAGGTAYAKNDVVYYATNGNAYIAKQATTGNVPTNATYWSQFAQGSGGIWDGSLSLGSAGQSIKVNSAGNALEFGTIDSGKIKQTHWQWDDQQASVPQTSSGSGTGLDIFNYAFTAQSANPHFILDLSVYVGRNTSGNDQGDVYIAAWIHDTSGGTIRYPFGFYKSANYRCNSAFRGLTGNYFLEETDAGQYSDTNNWGAMRYTYAGVMGNQQSPDTTASASSGISAGQGLTLSIHLGGSGDTWYNRTSSQTNSMSRSWFKLTELDGTL